MDWWRNCSGLRFMATLTGIAFLSHQAGSFMGAWGGGLIYDRLGSYDAAWKSAVLIGLIAGAFQMLMNVRPPAAPRNDGQRLAQRCLTGFTLLYVTRMEPSIRVPVKPSSPIIADIPHDLHASRSALCP